MRGSGYSVRAFCFVSFGWQYDRHCWPKLLYAEITDGAVPPLPTNWTVSPVNDNLVREQNLYRMALLSRSQTLLQYVYQAALSLLVVSKPQANPSLFLDVQFLYLCISGWSANLLYCTEPMYCTVHYADTTEVR